MNKFYMLVLMLSLNACLVNGPGTLPPEPLSVPSDEKCYQEPGYNYHPAED